MTKKVVRKAARRATEIDEADAPAPVAVAEAPPPSFDLEVQARSLSSQDPGQTVVAHAELPGGVLMQWGRTRAPYSGSTHIVQFAKPFGGIPAVTSSFLFERAASMTERYLMDVDERGFVWRNYTPLGELMWIAIGASADS